MKREVEREIQLPAFELERGDLELLWTRMRSLFPVDASVYATISISRPSERLTFESMEELRKYTDLRGSAHRFALQMRFENQSVSVSSGGVFSSAPILKVEGKTDVWCAGAIEAVQHVVRLRRVWYYWLSSFPFLFAFLLLSAGPVANFGPFRDVEKQSIYMLLSWLSVTAVFGYFALSKDSILPAATIVFTREYGFIRRYAAELGLVLGLLSLAFALYIWAVPNGA